MSKSKKEHLEQTYSRLAVGMAVASMGKADRNKFRKSMMSFPVIGTIMSFKKVKLKIWNNKNMNEKKQLIDSLKKACQLAGIAVYPDKCYTGPRIRHCSSGIDTTFLICRNISKPSQHRCMVGMDKHVDGKRTLGRFEEYGRCGKPGVLFARQ